MIANRRELLQALRESGKDRKIRAAFGRGHQRIEAIADGVPVGIRRYGPKSWEIYYEDSDRYRTFKSLGAMLKNSVVGRALRSGTLYYVGVGH